MGGCFSSTSFRDTRSRGVLLLGLDGAGATTILYQLVLGKRLETIPTLGVNNETIHADGVDLECWDIGGLDKMRPLWRQYSREADAVIFVVDAADADRMKLAAEELSSLYEPATRGDIVLNDRPLLVFANKQDLPKAANASAVEQVLKISTLSVETYKIFQCTANDRQSLQKGISWLTDQLKTRPAIAPSESS